MTSKRLLRLLVALSIFELCLSGDFFYLDFESIAGLNLNGDASTSSCDDGGPYAYNPAHGTNDKSDEGEGIPEIYSESTTLSSRMSSSTVNETEAIDIPKYRASFPHRKYFKLSPDYQNAPCPVRLRLTPSRPHKKSSAIRSQPSAVFEGFETGFTFQVTDASRQCVHRKDAASAADSYRTCSVAGGDGFAFVIHGDPKGKTALGESGSGIGYAGLVNAFAIEFDTWNNVDVPGDVSSDHLSIQMSPLIPGNHSTYITPSAVTRVAGPKRIPVADGAVHSVRIVYYPYLKHDLIPYFSASVNVLEYLTYNGVHRRVGTLAVYYDYDATTPPVIAFPVNLSTGLTLPGDQGWVGFTSSTGRAWQKHDILSWYWCDAPNCPKATADPNAIRYFTETGVIMPDPGR